MNELEFLEKLRKECYCGWEFRPAIDKRIKDLNCDNHEEDIVDKIIRESDEELEEIEAHTNKVKMDLQHDKHGMEESK